MTYPCLQFPLPIAPCRRYKASGIASPPCTWGCPPTLHSPQFHFPVAPQGYTVPSPPSHLSRSWMVQPGSMLSGPGMRVLCSSGLVGCPASTSSVPPFQMGREKRCRGEYPLCRIPSERDFGTFNVLV